MTKYYSTVLFSILLISCGTRINYLGTSSTPTKDVDVFVDASSIKKPYTIIGKGYAETMIGEPSNLEKVQAKAVAKAKEKGADAILFEDYYVADNGATVYKPENKKGTATKTSTVNSAISTKRDILFLKYD